MSGQAARALVLTAALAVGGACTGGDGRGEVPSPVPSSPGRAGSPTAPDELRCEPPFEAPEGFALKEEREVPQGDRVGVQRTYVDAAGRRLDLSAGVVGEWGEGAPLAGRFATTSGQLGRLLGRGAVWTFVWESPGPCAMFAVIGNGLSRAEMLGALEEMEVITSEN